MNPTISSSELGRILIIKIDIKWEYFSAIKMLTKIEKKLKILIMNPFL
jgi:hypothetical protein